MVRTNDDHEYMKRVGDTLRELRTRVNVTQAELGTRLNTSQSAISDMEQGRGITVPGLRRTVHALGFNFKITIERRYEV